ncbi:MAG: HD domain-containing protein [Clostridia bacterium]|nr:HD domain-containing protein [Clostridia bacterium]
MTAREEFLSIYRTHIHREGADKLLEYLDSPASDFFTAPASTRYHGSREGGLCEHSINVYKCLKNYLARPEVQAEYGLSYDEETIAIAALLHDICKVNCYKVSQRNVKGPDGKWQSVPYYEFDDQLPYGHGEKSVYIASGYMRLTREEAFAIRYHMGFSTEMDARNVGNAFAAYPLAIALYISDMEATYFVDDKKESKPC